MGKVLRESDEGVIVYIAPTKALVTQVVSMLISKDITVPTDQSYETRLLKSMRDLRKMLTGVSDHTIQKDTRQY
jgi:hypothetical protein